MLEIADYSNIDAVFPVFKKIVVTMPCKFGIRSG